MASPDVGPPSTLPHSFLQDGFHQARCRSRHTLQSQRPLRTGRLPIQHSVVASPGHATKVLHSIRQILIGYPLPTPTGISSDCRRLFVQQSLSVEERISQPDATCLQDLDEEEWPTFHATGKHFGLMPSPLVRTHPTDHQPYYKVLHQPTSVHIRRCHLPL